MYGELDVTEASWRTWDYAADTVFLLSAEETWCGNIVLCPHCPHLSLFSHLLLWRCIYYPAPSHHIDNIEYVGDDKANMKLLHVTVWWCGVYKQVSCSDLSRSRHRTLLGHWARVSTLTLSPHSGHPQWMGSQYFCVLDNSVDIWAFTVSRLDT